MYNDDRLNVNNKIPLKIKRHLSPLRIIFCVQLFITEFKFDTSITVIYTIMFGTPSKSINYYTAKILLRYFFFLILK